MMAVHCGWVMDTLPSLLVHITPALTCLLLTYLYTTNAPSRTTNSPLPVMSRPPTMTTMPRSRSLQDDTSLRLIFPSTTHSPSTFFVRWTLNPPLADLEIHFRPLLQ